MRDFRNSGDGNKSERSSTPAVAPGKRTGQGLDRTAQTNAPSGVTPRPSNASYELGHHFTDGSGPHTKSAWMDDTPERENAPNTGMYFETTAVALEGAQRDMYYGSVRWGWERGATGVLTQVPFTLVSQGAPSQNFLAAAGAWNTATTGGSLVARNAPTNVYQP